MAPRRLTPSVVQLVTERWVMRSRIGTTGEDDGRLHCCRNAPRRHAEHGNARVTIDVKAAAMHGLTGTTDRRSE